MKNTKKPIALLSVCLTGKGLALRIREHLEEKYPGVTILQLGIADKSFEEKAKELCEQYNIVAAIGTVNPEIEGINFIPFQPDILASQNNTLELLLNAKDNLGLKNMIDDDLLIVNHYFSVYIIYSLNPRSYYLLRILER
jgi:transcriptional regulatory protein LevR